MAITKIQSESLNLADDYAFTGTITGAGESNVPAFEAYKSSGQTLSQNTFTKITFQAEIHDTDSCYDNSTNYRFTPTTAGKYFCYTNIANDYTGSNSGSVIDLAFYKNGSGYAKQRMIESDSQLYGFMHFSMTIDFNGSSDYLEVYVKSPHPSPVVNGGSFGDTYISNFGAYLITT